ncbi:hypothetical protein V5N11_019012 [Cardamine amara subsp. amara]|uniref:Uncharacterized protein n=1 Tax=Cardamine amara subsp. amara TaxID=228776 RepID=A0ABD0ZAT0_CARAN
MFLTSSCAGVVLGENCGCLSLSQAISHGDLQGMKDFLMRRQVATTSWSDIFETPLQKACCCGQVDVVKELLLQNRKMPNEMESLALDNAAGNGNLETVVELCENNSALLRQENSDSYGLVIPVVRSSNAGKGEVTRYLYKQTPLGVLMEDEGYWATCLLLDAVFYGFLDIVLGILDRIPPDQVPSLAVTKHPRQRSSPLRFLALKPDLFRSHCDLGFWRRLSYSCMIP